MLRIKIRIKFLNREFSYELRPIILQEIQLCLLALNLNHISRTLQTQINLRKRHIKHLTFIVIGKELR